MMDGLPKHYFKERKHQMRGQLYRAIYRGDIEAAEDAINLMAMVDIDRDLIWHAKGVERG